NAAAMAGNLADVRTGGLSTVLETAPNGTQTSTLRTFNSLANMRVPCARSAHQCGPLFRLAAPPRGPAPQGTLAAVADIARNPAHNVRGLFALARSAPAAYRPALGPSGQPDAWVLALRFDGARPDAQRPRQQRDRRAGNVWVINNDTYSPDPRAAVCAGQLLFKFTPAGPSGSLTSTGQGSVTFISSNGATTRQFTGGGLTTPWGIAVDGNDNVWVSNFGGMRVSEMCGIEPANCPPGARTGQPISPATGYGFDGLTRDTSLQIDPSGNVWITNNWKTFPLLRDNPGATRWSSTSVSPGR
ncbi:MAG: hypothetical protein ACRDNT_20095, partial [Streptosporangiaceae bacterium]